MKVKYKIKSITENIKKGLTPNEEIYYKRWSILPDKFHLTYKKEYNIYGIEYTSEGYINFLLVDDTETRFPKIYPSDFFEVIDDRLSKYWIGTNECYYPIKEKRIPSLISFKEIVEDKYFFENILDCKKYTCDIFRKYKKLMDIEFPDKFSPNATLISDIWVMCNFCDESWVVSSENGIIICPNCKKENNNPLWNE